LCFGIDLFVILKGKNGTKFVKLFYGLFLEGPSSPSQGFNIAFLKG
jgi:hypothetical protein